MAGSGVEALQAASKELQPTDEVPASTRRRLRNAAGYSRGGHPPPFGTDQPSYSSPNKGAHDGFWLGSTAGKMPGYHMRAGGEPAGADRAGLQAGRRYHGRSTPMKAHVPSPASGKEAEQGASCRHHCPARRATMDTQAWRDGELEEHRSHRRAPGDCPGIDHLQGGACGVSQESAARRLAAPGERQPYDLVGTAARTISQAPEDTQQKVDPTSKHQRSIEDLQASIRALLGSQHSVDSLRAQQALPRNRHARAQLDTARTPYPQITSPPHDAAKTAFQTPRQDCLLIRLRGEGVPDLFTPRAGLASTL